MSSIELKAFEERDASLFSVWLKNDEEGMKFLESYSRPSEWIHLVNQKDRFLYIAFVQEVPIGFFDFEIIGTAGHFVVYLSAPFRGKGLGRQVLEGAFRLKILDSVEVLDVNVEKDNAPSIRLLEDAGFVQEGVDEEGMLIYKKAKPFQLS